MSKEMKKVLYIGNFSFPYGNASGARVLGNGLLFRELGYEVTFVGVSNKLKNKESLNSTRSTFRGFEYYNFPYPQSFTEWLAFNSKFHQFEELFRSLKYDIVVCYGSPCLSLFNYKLSRWCDSNGIHFLIDCVDMIPSTSGSIIHRVVKSLDEYYQKKVLPRNAAGLIVISSYLSNFYSDRGNKTVIIPPLIDLGKYESIIYQRSKDDVLRLIYVGFPFATDGRRVPRDSFKDRLDIAIEALGGENLPRFIFNIYGISKEQYLKVIPEHGPLLVVLDEKVKFWGSVDNEKVINEIANSDFTLLLRDVNEMTSAGFPTKVVESISCGTPVITTQTSDLKEYIVNNRTGFFVDINNLETLQRQLKDIFEIGSSDKLVLKEYCKDSKLFSYSKFRSRFSKFLTELN